MRFELKAETVDQNPLDEYIANEVEKFEVCDKSLMPLPVILEVKIPIQASCEILRRLSAHFINAATLFPGFDGIAEALKEPRLWDKK